MATISFLYRSIRDKAPLKLRLFYVKEGKSTFVEVPIKSEVTKIYWEKYHFAKRVLDIKIKNFQTELNGELNDLENHVYNAISETQIEKINKIWLLDVLDRFYSPSEVDSDDFLHWCEITDRDKKKALTTSTVKKNSRSRKAIEKFISQSRRDWRISDIGINFKREFENFCINKKYANNTIAVYMAYAKAVCNYAAINGVETSKTLSLVRVKENPVSSIFLTEIEIEKIANVMLPLDYLDNSRDWLLISCYTGQRVSDFMRFEKSMIRYEKNRKGEEKPLLEFVQEKTNKLMSIPLSKKAIEILNKRDGEFPRAISSVRYNIYIKKVCELAGIDEMVPGSMSEKGENGWRVVHGNYPKYKLVTSHIGRRSFATNNYGKIPTMYLTKMTGHATEQMFLTYIGKASKDIAMELSEYFD